MSPQARNCFGHNAIVDFKNDQEWHKNLPRARAGGQRELLAVQAVVTRAISVLEFGCLVCKCRAGLKLAMLFMSEGPPVITDDHLKRLSHLLSQSCKVVGGFVHLQIVPSAPMLLGSLSNSSHR